jgi:hypothetical protein
VVEAGVAEEVAGGAACPHPETEKRPPKRRKAAARMEWGLPDSTQLGYL